MTNRWEDIILTLSIMKPEAVDKERINMMLLMDETVDLQTIDNLQSLGVLTKCGVKPLPLGMGI